jgi:hypothetical protein
MNKLILWLAFILCLANFNAAFAATDLTGKTFVMTGKFLGTATANCKVAGTRNIPIRPIRRLRATINFNQGNVFLWSESGLPVGLLTNVTGIWSQRGNKVNLEFDDDSLSGIKSLGQLLPQAFKLQGVNIAVKNTKYSFSAKTNAVGNQLIVMETGGFKVNANGKIQGIRDSCVARATLKRVYKGSSP